MIQFLKSRCTKRPPYCSTNRHSTFEKGGRRQRCPWSYDTVCVCVLHESTTPETMKGMTLVIHVDINISYTLIHTSVRSCFKAFSHFVCRDIKCATTDNIKYTHEHEFLLMLSTHLKVLFFKDSTPASWGWEHRVFQRGRKGEGGGGVTCSCVAYPFKCKQ